MCDTPGMQAELGGSAGCHVMSSLLPQRDSGEAKAPHPSRGNHPLTQTGSPARVRTALRSRRQPHLEKETSRRVRLTEGFAELGLRSCPVGEPVMVSCGCVRSLRTQQRALCHMPILSSSGLWVGGDSFGLTDCQMMILSVRLNSRIRRFPGDDATDLPAFWGWVVKPLRRV